ncbi:hypothetical protein BBJ28_00010327 [Nothophytophthora sp. Chile5]|nr:hypothetical protein BBJ28_00010327 [Nothophytophthora sp. Chile5]
MSITEQIARKTRKSTVLDSKNALLIMAIPDYDDYKIMQPYSCRSLSSKTKFVGGRDFITRHNPQEVNDFKKQYSRDVGNLNRHRSILAPPSTILSATTLFASSSGPIGSLAPPPEGARDNNSKWAADGGQIWRKTFTSSMKACWVLTEHGIQTLIGPEYRLTTRVPVLPVLPSPRPQKPPILSLSCRSSVTFRKPETPTLSAVSARESIRKGVGVDLSDEKTLAALSRLAARSQRPNTPPCSPFKKLAGPTPANLRSPSNRSSAIEPYGGETDPNPSESSNDSPQIDGTELLLLAPYAEISWEKESEQDRDQEQRQHLPTPQSGSPSQQKKTSEFLLSIAPAVSPARLPVVSSALQPFAAEVSPPSLVLGTLHAGQVYLFPVRVRNVGLRQERFRVNRVAATSAGFNASIAEASYQREAARLAPGLAAIVTVALSFQHPGRVVGSMRVEAEGLGACDVEIKGVVR